MAGFLQGLGEFAGGVSKGISQEAEDRARRAQARAAEQEYDAKQAEDTRQAVLAQRIGGAPVVGQTGVGLGGVDYLLNQNTPPPAPTQDHKGLIGALAGLLSRRNTDDVAMASGVKPVPTLGVAAPPAAGGAPAAPAVAAPPAAPLPVGQTTSAAEQITGAAPSTLGVTAPPEPATPAQVPVAGTQGALLRPATDIDRQLYLSKAYADARQFDKSNAAYDKYGRLVVDRKMNAVDNMSPAEMSHIISDASGENFRVSQNKDDPTLFSLSKLEAGKDGVMTETPILRDVSRGELKGAYGQYINQDEDLRQKLISSSRDQRMAAIEARSNLAKNEAIIKHYAAQTAGEIEDTQGKAQARQHTAKVYDDIDFGKTEGSSILDPKRAEGLANDPTYNYPTKVQNPDGTSQTVMRNYMRDKLTREQTEYQTNKWSNPATQIVQRVKAPDGSFGFAVTDKNGKIARTEDGKQDAFYDTPSAAYNRAQGIYGNDAEAALKTVKAAQAAGKAPAAGAAPGAAGKGAPAARASPGLPKPPTPQVAADPKAAAQQRIAQIKDNAAAARQQQGVAARASQAAAAKEDADIANLKTQEFEMGRAARSAKDWGEKQTFLDEQRAITDRIHDLQQSQRKRIQRQNPLPVGVSGLAF